MIGSLQRYLDHLARTGDPRGSVLFAVEALADQPWEVVRVGALLGRCEVHVADADLGLSRQLEVRPVDADGVVLIVQAGQPYPVPAHVRRRRRGTWDPPIHVARQVLRAAVAQVDGPVRTLLDPACGYGAFLVAAVEAELPEVYGTDLDPLALEVARIAAPQARLLLEDGLNHGPAVDVVVGAPPFVPPERVDAHTRRVLRRRRPWLGGRFETVTPFAAAAVERARVGGAVGLVLPWSALAHLQGAVPRRRWLQRHRVAELSGPHPLPDADVEAALLVLAVGREPGPLPAFGLEPDELLGLDNAPLDPDLMPGDVALVRRIRRCCVTLRSVARVASGLVLAGRDGGSGPGVYDSPGDGRVRFGDAEAFFGGTERWIAYAPHHLHDARQPELFERAKIVVQRARGAGPIRAAVDTRGVYVDASCTLVQPFSLPPRRLLELVRSPIADAVTRVERGGRFDLYPDELGRFPVPMAWLDDPDLPLDEAWPIDAAEHERLVALARRV